MKSIESTYVEWYKSSKQSHSWGYISVPLEDSCLCRQQTANWLIRFLEQSHKIKNCKYNPQESHVNMQGKHDAFSKAHLSSLSPSQKTALWPCSGDKKSWLCSWQGSRYRRQANWDPASVSWEERPGDATATGGQDTIRHMLYFTTSAAKTCLRDCFCLWSTSIFTYTEAILYTTAQKFRVGKTFY